jgi:hypothetical protein
MIPKNGNRFSDEIMLKRKIQTLRSGTGKSAPPRQAAAWPIGRKKPAGDKSRQFRSLLISNVIIVHKFSSVAAIGSHCRSSRGD